MNRRALALVSAVVLSIVAGAWWLSEQTAMLDPPPAPTAAPLTRGAPPVMTAVPSPEPVVAAPTAAPDAGLVEVEIEVFQGAKQLVGERVELEGPGGRVSRPTDIMGVARFMLPEGTWRIIAPALRRVPPLLWVEGGPRIDWMKATERTTTLEVAPPVTRYRLELPAVQRFRGRVVDSQSQPAPGVDVRVFGGVFDPSEQKVTDTLGEFTVESTLTTLQVQAKRGELRSRVRAAKPDELVTLVLEEWTQLKVDSSPHESGCLYVRVMQRDDIIAASCASGLMLVPVGHLSVLARRNLAGRAHSGRAQIDAKAGIENHLEVELSPTPPITGTLVDAAGRPMPGLGLHIRQVELAERRPWSDVTAIVRADGGLALSALTHANDFGQFTWMPVIVGNADPLYQVLVVGLWQAKADPVLVKLDDAPLSIEVEPAPR